MRFLDHIQNLKSRRVHETIVAGGKQKVLNISLFLCVCVWVCVCVCGWVLGHVLVLYLASMQRAAILSPAASLALPYFSTLSHRRHDFRKEVAEHKMCVLILSTTFVWNISHSKKNLARYFVMSKRRHVKYTLFLSGFNETLILLKDFWKKLKYQVSSKSVQWEPSCSIRTDGRTDAWTQQS